MAQRVKLEGYVHFLHAISHLQGNKAAQLQKGGLAITTSPSHEGRSLEGLVIRRSYCFVPREYFRRYDHCIRIRCEQCLQPSEVIQINRKRVIVKTCNDLMLRHPNEFVARSPGANGCAAGDNADFGKCLYHRPSASITTGIYVDEDLIRRRLASFQARQCGERLRNTAVGRNNGGDTADHCPQEAEANL